MPILSFQNDDHKWVAVSLQWGTSTKNFTLQAGSNPENFDTLSPTVWYAWKPDNEVIDETEFKRHAVELTEDATFYYGDPPQGRVPVAR